MHSTIGEFQSSEAIFKGFTRCNVKDYTKRICVQFKEDIVVEVSQNKKNLAILMYILIALGGIVVDIIVPSLPSIRDAMLASEFATQWSFSAAMLGFGVGQIVAGIVVDSLGRKKPMVIGAGALSALLAVSAYSPNIYFLILVRLFQGLAVSFVAVGGRAAIKDMFDGSDYLKAVNWITISFAMGITLSPFVGGYIEQHFGWEMVFTALSVWTILGVLLLSSLYSETGNFGHSINTGVIRNNFRVILGTSSFRIAGLICGVFYSVLPAFNTVGPFLVQSTLGYSPVFYGYIALGLGACWLLGNLINRVLFSTGEMKKVSFSIGVSSLAIFVGILYQIVNGLHLVAFVAPVAIVIISLGILFPLFLGKALAPFGSMAGLANALVFSGCWLATAIVSFVTSSLPSSTAVPLLALYALLLAVVGGVYFSSSRRSTSTV